MFSSAVGNGGGFWLYRFDEPGTYDLLCAPHEFFGMVMRIVVGDPDDPNYDGDFGDAGPPGTGPRAPVGPGDLATLGITTFPFPTAGEVFDTAVLEVDNIVDNGPISVEDVEDDL